MSSARAAVIAPGAGSEVSGPTGDSYQYTYTYSGARLVDESVVRQRLSIFGQSLDVSQDRMIVGDPIPAQFLSPPPDYGVAVIYTLEQQ